MVLTNSGSNKQVNLLLVHLSTTAGKAFPFFALRIRKRLFLLMLLIGAGNSPASLVQDQGHGTVSMAGSIIDTPCAIDVPSRDQTIDMATLPLGQIIRDGQGPTSQFSIQLVNCTLTPLLPNRPDWSHFQVTFDGPTVRGNLFSVSGRARGVGLQIADAAGAIAVPGKPMPAYGLQLGDMRLNYTLRLVGDRHSLRAGTYQTTLRFKLDYF
ncbi:fimbrial protein [Cedecea neteri]|uniref:fimbrial protein n=1 Tax=Cedecea neteri TaxID=158822 RepID=UPI002AA735AA|nr:fimbrial protein [Cedecea neteri]WPU21985.1 fimbrial protein [Cedecea neteri]